jgi:glycosyltransferase involved in cell wall biosynthesis
MDGRSTGPERVQQRSDRDRLRPLASVVIPTRDRARVLETCLQSLAQLSLEGRFEIIVIDDGSRDGTAAVVERFGAGVDGTAELRYERQDGLGLNAARNRGVALSRSELVCLIDDDTEVPAGWLQAIVDGAAEHPEADVLGGPIRLRVEGREPRHCHADRLPETELDRGPRLVWDEKLWGANLTVRRAAVQRFGGFDETLGVGDEEEWEDRVLAAGGRTLYVPGAWLWHRRTDAELGRRYLIRRSYRIGYSQVPYRLRFGHKVTIAGELWRVLRGLGHALLLGCFYGLLRSSRHWGAVRRLWDLRKDRT